MEIGVTVLIVALLIIVIWVIIEMKRFRHKLFAIFLIILVLFTYLSFTIVLKEKDVDFKTIPGMINAAQLYFSWLGSVFGNVKSITTNAIKMDWQGNRTIG